MVLSSNIQQYIDNSKLRGQLCHWDKNIINVYITEITANISNKEFMYFQVQKAMISWNEVFKTNGINLQLYQVYSAEQADVTIRWVKVGRVYEGMCKYLSIVGNTIKKISIEIGLPNEYSGKNTTDLSIYCAIMHEFGHAVGLGHGVDIDDIMFVPHQKNISVPSENDLFVLKKLYR